MSSDTEMTYADVYFATIKAMDETIVYPDLGFDVDFSYDGYSGANAVSYYLDQKMKINVVSASAFNDAFNDAFNGLAPTRKTIADKIIEKYKEGAVVNLPNLMRGVNPHTQDQCQNWDEDSTHYDFRDGSVILVLNGTVQAHLGRHITTPRTLAKPKTQDDSKCD